MSDIARIRSEVGASAAGERLDRFISELEAVNSRTQAEALIREGSVLVDGLPRAKSHRLREGEIIEVTISPAAPAEIAPEEVPFTIVYQDEWLAVISKPAGIVVHPAPGHDHGTLVHGLIGRLTDLSGIGGVERPGIVHRLDKETSGLMLVAKNDRAHLTLSEQLKKREVTREYYALVEGELPWADGDIDAPIGRDPHDRKRMGVTADGKPSLTYFKVLERLPGHTLLDVRLATGRTHQIRVHLAHIGFPVLGDALYGSGRGATSGRHFLHAYRLSFSHPGSGEKMLFEDPLPLDFQGIMGFIRGKTAAE